MKIITHTKISTLYDIPLNMVASSVQSSVSSRSAVSAMASEGFTHCTRNICSGVHPFFLIMLTSSTVNSFFWYSSERTTCMHVKGQSKYITYNWQGSSIHHRRLHSHYAARMTHGIDQAMAYTYVCTMQPEGYFTYNYVACRESH